MKNIVTLFVFFLALFLSASSQTLNFKEKYNDYFPIGAAIGKSYLSVPDTLLLKIHFSGITAENDMKPERTIQKGEMYTFEAGNRLVSFAKENNMLVKGRNDYSLLFNADYQPKKAFFVIIDFLNPTGYVYGQT